VRKTFQSPPEPADVPDFLPFPLVDAALVDAALVSLSLVDASRVDPSRVDASRVDPSRVDAVLDVVLDVLGVLLRADAGVPDDVGRFASGDGTADAAEPAPSSLPGSEAGVRPGPVPAELSCSGLLLVIVLPEGLAGTVFYSNLLTPRRAPGRQFRECYPPGRFLRSQSRPRTGRIRGTNP